MELNILINKGRQKSLSENLNYFAQFQNIYIMDNHLAAIWCWEKLPKNKPISIVHIDAHYDLGYAPPGEFIYADIDLTQVHISDLTNFQYKEDYQYFMWDNYIHLFCDKYPNLIHEFISITQQLGNLTSIKGAKIEEYNIWNIVAHQCFEIEKNYVLNLDIDFFFNQEHQEKIEIFSPEMIDTFSQWIFKKRNKFQQITIALSPECCGSWDKAINMANRILTPFDVKLSL